MAITCSIKASGEAVSWLKYFATTCHVASLDCTNHSPKLPGEVNGDGDVGPDGGVLGDAGGDENVDQYFDDGGETFLPADHVSN